MAVRTMRRDPFAKIEMLRQSHGNSDKRLKCSWCDQHPRTIYDYRWEDDNHHQYFRPGFFCNIQCFEAYYG